MANNEERYNPYKPTGTYEPVQPYEPVQSHQPVQPYQPVQPKQSGFERGEFSPDALGSKKKRSRPGPMREYRDNQGNLCTKGGRLRCFGRICCCSLMTTVFLIVSIVLTLALFIRPPSITIGSVVPTSGDSNPATGNGIRVALGVDISVSNPNYFDVDFQKIEVELLYPINNNNIPVGGGIATNLNFKSRVQTNFTFPFVLSYNSTEAQATAIFTDLATKCGVTGGTKSNLDVNYKISLGIRILMVVISPVISNTFSFPCPISSSEISKLVNGLNLSLG